jgi:DNA-binding beta-propeller fold protein YncE
VCIDLPTRGSDDDAATADWGVVATADGRSTLAVNATLGMIVDVDPGELSVRRVVEFEPSARRGVTLAKFGHAPAGAVGRRVVAAPDGSAVFAAGARGIVRIETADLTVSRRSLEGDAIDAIAITPDGATLYALVREGGRIARIDTATGKVVGWAAGDGYDRLVGVVPW